jgi:hypothetical protein
MPAIGVGSLNPVGGYFDRKPVNDHGHGAMSDTGFDYPIVFKTRGYLIRPGIGGHIKVNWACF